MVTAPLSLFKLLAHHADGAGPHLQPGVHLRWFSAPPLNLPFDLFQIERADASGFREFFSEEVSWFNRFGQAVAQPFTLPAGEEVIGVLPAGEDVLAVEVRFIPALSVGLTGTGEVATPNGYQPVAAMSPSGWLLTPGIQRLRLRGPGQIIGARWVQLSKMEPRMVFKPVAQVGLPAGPKARYNGTPDFESAAIERVRHGAPLRSGLHDDPDAFSPATAAPADPDREKERVLSLARPDLEKVLEVLLDDTSDIPIRLESKEDLNQGVTGQVPLLAALLTALIDPGLARWLGFADLDADQIPAMTLYRVTGAYRLDEIDRTLLSNAQKEFLPAVGKIALSAYCLANPQPAFAPPPLESVSSAVAQSGLWISGGDALLRLASVRFRLPPGQVDFIALRRGKPGSGSFNSMNDANPAGFHLPLAARKPPDAADPRFRRLRDAGAPADAQEYGVAVADVFGRWSDWAPAVLADGVRVPPPAPVVRADYLPADRDPVDDSLRAGQVRCRSTLPQELAPGTPTITSAELRLSVLEGGSETLFAAQDVPVAPGALEVAHAFLGPGLERGARRSLVVRARFLAGALASEDGLARVEAADPRPPAPLVIIPDVAYSTRPDGSNLSTVRLSWALGPGHAAYRVYRSSQRALEPFLAALGAAGQEALDLVRDPRATPQAVATAIQVHAAALPKDAFELLTRELVRPDTAGNCTHLSTLPGRSRMLYLYRVLAVNSAGVEEDWRAAPALFYVAVPPSIRLQPPRLELSQVGDSVRVSVLANPGQPAGAVRIFRSTNPAAMLDQMTRVAEAPVPPPAGGAEQIFMLLDGGASPFNPAGRLKEWSRYTYRAQLQASPQPGEPPGVWSDPSAPVSLHFIPPSPPPAPSITGLARGVGVDERQVSLTWENPALRIRATSLGNHHYRILRSPAGGGFMEEVTTIDSLLPAQFTDPDAPEGMVYVVETIDPSGRRAASAPSVVV